MKQTRHDTITTTKKYLLNLFLLLVFFFLLVIAAPTRVFTKKWPFFVENSSEGVEQETDIRVVWMGTGEDGGHIGTRLRLLQCQKRCALLWHIHDKFGKKRQAQLRR